MAKLTHCALDAGGQVTACGLVVPPYRNTRDAALVTCKKCRKTPIFKALEPSESMEARLARLEADNARYREALEEIVRTLAGGQYIDWYDVGRVMTDLARTALTASDEQATLVTGENRTNE